jgi:hypothetical protein
LAKFCGLLRIYELYEAKEKLMKTPHRGTVPKHKQASNYATRVAGIKSGPKYGRQQQPDRRWGRILSDEEFLF